MRIEGEIMKYLFWIVLLPLSVTIFHYTIRKLVLRFIIVSDKTMDINSDRSTYIRSMISLGFAFLIITFYRYGITRIYIAKNPNICTEYYFWGKTSFSFKTGVKVNLENHTNFVLFNDSDKKIIVEAFNYYGKSASRDNNDDYSKIAEPQKYLCIPKELNNFDSTEIRGGHFDHIVRYYYRFVE